MRDRARLNEHTYSEECNYIIYCKPEEVSILRGNIIASFQRTSDRHLRAFEVDKCNFSSRWEIGKHQLQLLQSNNSPAYKYNLVYIYRNFRRIKYKIFNVICLQQGNCKQRSLYSMSPFGTPDSDTSVSSVSFPKYPFVWWLQGWNQSWDNVFLR